MASLRRKRTDQIPEYMVIYFYNDSPEETDRVRNVFELSLFELAKKELRSMEAECNRVDLYDITGRENEMLSDIDLSTCGECVMSANRDDLIEETDQETPAMQLTDQETPADQSNMTINGTIDMVDVPSAKLATIIEGFNMLQAPYTVYVKCIGATRKGDICFLNTTWHQLIEKKPTARKQFFNIDVDNIPTLVHPEHNIFPQLRVVFHN